MSATAVVWLIVFGALLVASTRRQVYACCAYLMTYFAAPQFWWWGKGVLTSFSTHWNLYAALAFALVVVANWGRRAPISNNCVRAAKLALLFVFNAFIVHNFFAANPEVSAKYFDLLWKSVGLAFLIRLSLCTGEDLQIFLFAIVLLCGYVGFEVVANGAGTTIAGRLEGIGIANASGANGIAAIMSMGLILCGYFAISSHLPLYYKLSAIGMAPLILDTVLRCNSRGAYLGLIGSGAWIYLAARTQVRKRILLLICVGAASILFQAADERIWERFNSIFVEADNRDNSAASRILYWQAALEMAQDYPFGKGAKAAFKSDLGVTYIEHFHASEYRSVHNGFLDCLVSWGIQGFSLFAAVFAISFWALHYASKNFTKDGQFGMSLLGATLQAVIVGQLICTCFTSILDGEWYLWLVATNLAYATCALHSSSGEDLDLPDLEAVYS